MKNPPDPIVMTLVILGWCVLMSIFWAFHPDRNPTGNYANTPSQNTTDEAAVLVPNGAMPSGSLYRGVNVGGGTRGF